MAFHEVDPGSARRALEFTEIMDATPADLKKRPTNIYSQIAISIKGGELREPGLANLAARLAAGVPPQQVDVSGGIQRKQSSFTALRATSSRMGSIDLSWRASRKSLVADVNVESMQFREEEPATPHKKSPFFSLGCSSERIGDRKESTFGCTSTGFIMSTSWGKLAGRRNSTRNSRKSTPNSCKSTPSSDVNAGEERPTSCRDGMSPMPQRHSLRDDTPEESAAGVLPIAAMRVSSTLERW